MVSETGKSKITYRIGAGPATVHLRVRNDDKVRPIWTVTGRITGTESPDQLVILGNHRDAWVYGGVDPSSGTASLMELARTADIDLANALARLDPADRALLALRYVAGFDSRELARATGRSPSGTRARLARLLDRLRTELRDD